MESGMNPADHSVTYWLAAAKDGDLAAGQALFERYFGRLVAVSRNAVPRKRRVEDEEDAALAAMYAFLRGIEHGRFPDVSDRQTLWPLLVRIVVSHSRKQLRKQLAAKRQDAAVRGDSVLADLDETSVNFAEVAIHTIDEQAMVQLEDSIQAIRSQLGELEREIFDLKLLEHSNREVATLLGRPSRTIDRKVNSVILPLVVKILQLHPDNT